MERKEEIIELLRFLLRKSTEAIDGNQYSSCENEVVKSTKEVIEISKQMKKYIDELES